MGKLEKKKLQIQKRLKAAKDERRRVIQLIREKTGGNKKKEGVVDVSKKDKKNKRSTETTKSGGDDNEVKRPSKKPRKDPEASVDDDLVLDVDVVKFGERVDAPPSLSLKSKSWAKMGGLHCVKALMQPREKEAEDNPIKESKMTKEALRKQAVEGYRRMKGGQQQTSGRATMESLRMLVAKEEQKKAITAEQRKRR